MRSIKMDRRSWCPAKKDSSGETLNWNRAELRRKLSLNERFDPRIELESGAAGFTPGRTPAASAGSTSTSRRGMRPEAPSSTTRRPGTNSVTTRRVVTSPELDKG